MRASLLRWIERVLLGAGFACLAASVWTVSERTWFQKRYSVMDYTAPAPAGAESVRPGPLGRIEIPRVGVSAVILDGVEGRTLRRGVGHVPGTAYPGSSGGRIALAAHRDTFFRNLRLVRAGDTVKLTVPGKTAIYQVERTEVVKPWQTEVLEPVDDDVLTLLTCFPFTYLGKAPERFVVEARRVGPGQFTPGPGARLQP